MDRPSLSLLHPSTFAPPRGTRWLLVVALVLHAAVGATLGLSVDEAHYALYALHPALSYFDHPPLVGWVQWPLVVVNAPDALLRVVPGALWLATVWLVHGIAQHLQHLQALQDSSEWPGSPADAGLWAVLALLLAPLLHVLAIGLLPDTLLMFFSVALMALTLRMVASAPTSTITPFQWLLLGVLLGLAGLGKYTAIFTALAVLLCLVAARGFGCLRSPWPWVALVVALAIVSPVAIWNAQNGWISFTYQADHGAGEVWQWSHLLQFVLIQAVAYGPLMLWGVWGVARSAPRVRTLAGFFAIPFAVLVALSGGGTGLPHWTAPAWVALAPFAGMALAAGWNGGAGLKGWQRRGITALAVVQALACVALVALMVGGGMPFFSGRAASADTTNAPNPFADLHGWDAAGVRAQQLAQQQGLDSVSVQNWTLASRLGWYARPLKVHVLQDRFDQFDIWAGKLPVGGSTLLVDWSQLPFVTPLGAHGFAQCTRLDSLNVQRLGYDLAHFDFYACQGWSGSPAPRLQPDARATP
jgi:hypothetical protein